MNSCWLIEFKDGHKIIISESLYIEEEKRNFDNRQVLVEQHWFDYEVCKERNRGIWILMNR
ncbi:hypothetical protein [Priestia flexa]|uniref:hypothetical protein n=1 Tax=Priestia flexa TaxID=86664 RepID=UPI0004737A8D|nr:hypothetical protein [Priestia flexa]